MNLLNKLTKKNLLLNKKRTVVTIIGIMLSVALICAVASIYTSGIESLIVYERKVQGDYHYVFKNVNDLTVFQNNRKIERMFYLNHLGYAVIDSKNDYKPYVHIISLDDTGFNNLSFTLMEGRLPQNSHEIIISNHVKTNGKVELEVGDEITLDIGKRVSEGYELTQDNPYIMDNEEIIDTKRETYKIVGIIERPVRSIESFEAPGYTFITYMENHNKNYNVDVYARYTKDGLKNHYSVTANILGIDPVLFQKGMEYDYKLSLDEQEKFVDELNKAKYSFNYNDYLITLESNPLKMSSVSSVGTIVMVVCGIIVLTSVFCIKNSFDISITEKIKQYGMLRSLGATKKQIKKNVFYEAFILGVIGIPLGILLGIFATYILVMISNYYLANSFEEELTLLFSISYLAITASIILGIVTIYFSSLRSAIKASCISSINAIRNSSSIKIDKKKLKSPLWVHKIFGIGGDISYKNLKRNRKKYRTTVISIIVSVAVFIALSSFINMTYREVHSEYKYYEYNLSYSINVLDNTILNKVYKTLKLDNIKDYSLAKENFINIMNPSFNQEYLKVLDINYEDSEQEYIYVVGLENDVYNNYLKSLGIKKTMNGQVILIDQYDFTVYNKEKDKNLHYNMHKYSYKIGDTLNINNEDSKELTIGYITDKRPFGYQTHGALLVVDNTTFDEIFPKRNDNYYWAYFYSMDANKLEEDINTLLNGETYYMNNLSKTVKTMENFFTLVAIFLYGFIIVISLIGITNIFNTITTSMMLRAPSFAMLESVGMTKKEFKKMIRLESIFMGIKALSIGIPIGIGLSYLIYMIIKAEAFISYELPIKAIVISIIAVYLLITMIMMYSMNKIRKQNTIETIRNENI